MMKNTKNKSANKDFEESMLPINRKSVFFDVFKLRFKELFLVGLILLISFLPSLIVLFFKDNEIIKLSQGTSLTLDQARLTAYQISRNYSLLLIPAFMISSIGLAGVLRLIRQMVWLEPLLIKYDFKLGIKNSLGYTLIVTFIIGLLIFGKNFMSYLTDNDLLSSIIFIVALVFFFSPLLMVIYQSEIYKNSFFKCLKKRIFNVCFLFSDCYYF